MGALAAVSSGFDQTTRRTPSALTITFSIQDYNEFIATYPANSPCPPKLSGYPGAKCGKERNIWNFPLVNYSLIINQLKQDTTAALNEIPAWVFTVVEKINEIAKNFKNKEISIDRLMRRRIPRQLLDTLMKFQYNGVRQAVLMNGRLLLGDEMGLGKTSF